MKPLLKKVIQISGWISIHRKIQDHWIWGEKPFSKGQAWIDILMMVNHEDKKILLGSELVEVKRGSRVTSIRKLCERWGWSNTKVRTFLRLLEEDNMLIVKSDTKKTVLTVVSYSDYQDTKDTKNNTKASRKRHESDTKATRKHTNNNDNNDNNDNKDIYKYIVEYLNERTNKNFRYSTKATQRFIDARLNEGFTLDDFKKVIDIKANQWTGSSMESYLRPQTLFGTKFESYLNEEVSINGKYTGSSNGKVQENQRARPDLSHIGFKGTGEIDESDVF